ncbi:LytR/AlgR family response regulator transcription factor [Vibrio nereis]|uniref:Chemotaxis protein CheY n=1 Tax=Vibrio nereis TaxID=693 RepID=A0A0M0HSS6_VIBNE|nr:LytTR family DNA-binding domain-containing protein [Vibrio nereis]KOO04673.1 chemotaxis protein CheY [Vibrio nereis]
MHREPMTALIADDEPLLRHHLNKALGEVWPELDVIASAENGHVALKLIEQHTPDIAFLDIKMPELDGMSVAKKLAQSHASTKVVFITAYDEFAVKAFEANAVDYLLKPVSEARLMQCVEKVKAGLQPQSPTASPDLSQLLDQIQHLTEQKAPSYLHWIRANRGEEIHMIPASEVLYFKAEDKYVSLLRMELGEKQEYLLRTSLKELIKQLNPELFWQIHRSIIVNVSAIDKVKKEFTGKMVALVGDTKLPVSRAMQSRFTNMW